MPEYLAPGVYVEETSFRAKSIEGVSTTTTGFIGPTRYGPLDIESEIVTSLVEFEQASDDLGFDIERSIARRSDEPGRRRADAFDRLGAKRRLFDVYAGG